MMVLCRAVRPRFPSVDPATHTTVVLGAATCQSTRNCVFNLLLLALAVIDWDPEWRTAIAPLLEAAAAGPLVVRRRSHQHARALADGGVKESATFRGRARGQRTVTVICVIGVEERTAHRRRPFGDRPVVFLSRADGVLSTAPAVGT